MSYKPITKDGINFIYHICKGSGDSLISGKNPQGILPYCEESFKQDTWTSKVAYNGNVLTKNEDLGIALITWYNKYAKEFDLDANILAAQAYQESGYKLWNYPISSTASGLCQFINDTTYDVIIVGNYYKFSQNEINAINKDLTGNLLDRATYSVGNNVGKKNRPIFFQNIIDNPEIMIKAQCAYMRYISNKCNSLASSALFGYNRGPKYVRTSYSDSIRLAATSNKVGYENEGVDYVFKIFGILGDKDNLVVSTKTKPQGYYFGYDHLNLKSYPPTNFDKFKTTLG